MGVSQGGKVMATSMNEVMDVIKRCRSKWGSGYNTVYVPSVSEQCTAEKVNQYVTWLNDVKGRTRPGNSISVPAPVKRGDYITASWVNSLINAGNAIYNHCHSNCHSNCNCNCDCAGCDSGIN